MRYNSAECISNVLSPEIVIAFAVTIGWAADDFLNIDAFVICIVLLCLMQTVAKSDRFMIGTESEDRKKAYAITMASYLICTILMILFWRNSPITFVSLSLLVGTVIMAVINTWVKISVHCGSVSLCASAITVLIWPFGAISLLLVPIVCWSRLSLEKHTPFQAVLGTIVGLTIPILIHLALNLDITFYP